MAKDTSTSATAQPEQPQGKMSGHEDDSKLPGSFHPHHITLETFRRLLSHYSSTVEQAHSRKIRSKLHSRSKSAKVSKRKVEKASAASTTNAELDPSEEKQIREETEKFLQLDRWRYELLPKIIAGRKATQGINETGEKGAYLLKEELLDIMEWKLKHGVFRPMLMGMIKSNQATTVTNSTSAAFAVLPDADPMLAPNEAFPKASLDALTGPLRGVGPATASLVLSIATVVGEDEKQVPFYSDDVYLWLCLLDFPESRSPEGNPSTGDGSEDSMAQKSSKHKKPNGELIAKYNLKEYQALWDASQNLRARLNRNIEDKSEGECVSLIDIERAAYVLRNIHFSDYYTRYPDEIVGPVRAADSLSPKKPKGDSGEFDKRNNKKQKQ